MARYLGIDPGSQISGYACIEVAENNSNFSVNIVDVGILRVNPKWSFIERLVALEKSLVKLIAEHKPEFFSIEKAFSHKNPSSALKLGEIRGVFVVAAAKAGLEIMEFAPKSIKKIVTGNGNASKEMVYQSLRALLNFELQGLPFDASDALAIAYSQSISCHSNNQINNR